MHQFPPRYLPASVPQIHRSSICFFFFFLDFFLNFFSFIFNFFCCFFLFSSFTFTYFFSFVVNKIFHRWSFGLFFSF